MLTIIKACVGLGTDVRILDPKNADLADLEEVLPKKVYSQKNGILMCLRKSVDGMMERMDEMKQMPNYKTGENYAYLGLKPVFIFFDEYVAFMDLLDMKERNEALSYMKQLVMLGRQAGYFLVLGAQRPDAKYLADGIRDQFSFRVSLGLMSETGYGMMFGDVDKAFVNKKKLDEDMPMLAQVQCWNFTALSYRKDMILCHLLKMRWLESRERRRRQSPAAA